MSLARWSHSIEQRLRPDELKQRIAFVESKRTGLPASRPKGMPRQEWYKLLNEQRAITATSFSGLVGGKSDADQLFAAGGRSESAKDYSLRKTSRFTRKQ
ncbi:MAG: hypothetical protein EOO39_00635 [Cytophagaceae bacterium]|nr:MAG: hypothetical protein EOO39_00635 [Cytophagaceae bacterium]